MDKNETLGIVTGVIKKARGVHIACTFSDPLVIITMESQKPGFVGTDSGRARIQVNYADCEPEHLQELIEWQLEAWR